MTNAALTSSGALATSAESVATPKRARIASVDIVRGIAMILMALDHTREYFGAAGINPTNLAQTTVPLFFTRWITHVCAPIFFLLTGTGAYLSLRRKSVPQLSRFLATRGLWLIFVEVVLLRCLGWQFNFDYQVTLLFVLWALGWAMIALSVLVYLPVSVVAAFGLLLIAGHNLLDSVQSTNPLWVILHAPGFVAAAPPHVVFVAYPLVPWIGVTAAGYVLGQVYAWAPERRKAFLWRAGLAAVAAFVVLRAVNVYGDPSRWAGQRSAIFTALSFVNTTKYPPSLLFLLMTLGPALLALRAFDGHMPRWARPVDVIGKVPMFYFVLHVPLIHLLAVIACYARYGDAHWMFQSPALDRYPITQPPGWGFSLPVVYLIWVGVVIALYPLCRWFAGVKQRRSDPWLSYF
ncbi:MAG TPA: heparan-alpha-glucosaminide N-acetyltransferase domain-containing protein [Gemmatimonadales bacterium]|nr:heparan-alpha-glucosaminide N-acetyltransferase domain-containing protein [Gemmatimonadales bacterium]